MPMKHSNGNFYLNRTFPAIGERTRRSLGTPNRGLAEARERAVTSLHDQGQLHLVRAVHEGRLSIERLHEAFEAGTLHELAAELDREDVSLEAAIEALETRKKADVAESTLQGYKAALGFFAEFVGDVSVREALTTDHVQAFKAHRRSQKKAKETVNNDLGAISVLASLALEKGWIEERPQINRYRSKVRVNYLEPDQVNAYLEALRPAFRALFRTLLGTGMRLGEAEALRACDLRFGPKGTRAMIRDSKTPEGVRTVFVPSGAAELLRREIERRELGPTDPLFPIPRRTVQKEHNRACETAKIVEYTIHDHRHTAAVQLARAGMPLNLIQQQLGHTNIDMTMRYARFNPVYGDVSAYFDRVEATLEVRGEKRGDSDEEAREAAA